MNRGRKPLCFGNFTDDDKIHMAYGDNSNLRNTEGWGDAGFYCLTLCRHKLDCIEEKEKVKQE